MKAYIIPFSGLKPGIYHFNYEIDDQFFSHYPESLISQCRLFVDLSFEKKERLFILTADVSGIVQTECDRCGELFDLPIHGLHHLFVKIGVATDQEDEEEDIIWIAESESEIDVSDWLYECMHLSLPLRKLHPENAAGISGCNPDVIQRLRSASETESRHDPRWDKLNLLNEE